MTSAVQTRENWAAGLASVGLMLLIYWPGFHLGRNEASLALDSAWLWQRSNLLPAGLLLLALSLSGGRLPTRLARALLSLSGGLALGYFSGQLSLG